MNQNFFFKLAADLVEIAEQDMRVNVMTVDDGECENLKIVGIDRDSENPCLKVEDDGDQCYIFIRHIISITPTEADEEEENDGENFEPEDAPEEDA